MGRFITIQEAADELGVTAQTVRRLIRLGDLAARQVAGRQEVDRDTVLAKLAAAGQPVRRAPAPAPPPRRADDAITAEQACLAEETFLRQVEQRVAQVSRLVDPLTGREIAMSPGRVGREVDGDRVSKSAPLNRGIRLTVRAGTMGATVVVEGCFLSRRTLFASRGRDGQPLETQDLVACFNGLNKRLASAGEFHLVIIGSPTGWSDDATQLVTRPGQKDSFLHRMAATALWDLRDGMAFADETDVRLCSFWPVIDPARYEREVSQCAAKLKDELLAETAITVNEAARRFNMPPVWVLGAFDRLKRNSRYGLSETNGQPTLYRRGA